MSALRPMTAPEYAHLMSYMWEDYAQERARNFHTPIEEERADAERQHPQLLPDGLNTPSHHFWTVIDDSGAAVGSLWVFVDEPKQRAFIYNIVIDAAQRGKGYGRRALELLEAILRQQGVTRIALNVFGDNSVAQALYRKVGYDTVATYMQKEI
jgi:ribosomal protein S18 acetylase RimI-like enzyme